MKATRIVTSTLARIGRIVLPGEDLGKTGKPLAADCQGVDLTVHRITDGVAFATWTVTGPPGAVDQAISLILK